MATMRAIRPETFTDDWLGSLDYFHRWLWIGLFSVAADDQGRFWLNPLKIRAEILPHPKDATVTDEQITQAIKTFENAGKIHIYYQKKKSICQIVSWWKHQTPRWANKSEYPPPEKWKDRERYSTGQGKTPHTLNWELPGGFSKERRSAKENGESVAHNMYADNIDIISPFEEEVLNTLVAEHSQEWVVEAIEIAVKNNVKKLSYISAILEKWGKNGKTTGKKATHKDYLDGEFAEFIEK